MPWPMTVALQPSAIVAEISVGPTLSGSEPVGADVAVASGSEFAGVTVELLASPSSELQAAAASESSSSTLTIAVDRFVNKSLTSGVRSGCLFSVPPAGVHLRPKANDHILRLGDPHDLNGDLDHRPASTQTGSLTGATLAPRCSTYEPT